MIKRKRKQCRKLVKECLTYNEFMDIRFNHLDKIIKRKEIMKEIVDIDIFKIYIFSFDCYDDLTILETPLRNFFKWLNTAKYFYDNPESYRASFYLDHITHYEDCLHYDYCTRLSNSFYSKEELEHIDEIVKRRREEINNNNKKGNL